MNTLAINTGAMDAFYTNAHSSDSFIKNKENGENGLYLYQNEKKRLVAKFDKELIPVTYKEHQPSYHHLEIFQTKFGMVLEEFLIRESNDVTLFDSNIEVVAKENIPSTCELCGSQIKTEKEQKNIKYLEKKFIAKGYTQSGKTAFIVSYAIRNLLFGQSTVILLRALNCDLVQLTGRFNAFIAKFLNFAKEHGFQGEFPVDMSPMIIESKKVNFPANSPRIIIAISSSSSLEKLSPLKNFVLMIDEVDFVDSSSPVRSPSMDKIRNAASLVIGVTATPLATASEWKTLRANCIRELSKPENYVGLDPNSELIKFHEVNTTGVIVDSNGKEKILALKSGETDIKKIFKCIPSLEDYIKKFSTTVKEKQEATLLRFIDNVAPQQAVFDYILENYPDVAVAGFYGEGCVLAHSSFTSNPIQTTDGLFKSKVTTVTLNEKTFYSHSFSKSVEVGSIFAIIQEKNIKKFISIAGVKSSRSISFTSNLNVSPRLHINSMFLKLSTGTVNSEIIQIVGRITGRFEDVTKENPQKVYCSADDCETIQKAYLTLEELLKLTSRKYGDSDAKVLLCYNGRGVLCNAYVPANIKCIETMSYLLEQLTLNKFKCVVYKKISNKTSRKITRKITARKAVTPALVDDDGSGDTEDSYKFTSKIIKDSSSEEDSESYSEEEKSDDSVEDEEEFKRLRKIFATWSKADSKIARFMQNLDPVKVYSKNEIQELAGGHGIKDITQLSIVSYKNKSESKGYGKILYKRGETYHLQPQLVNAFKKHF